VPGERWPKIDQGSAARGVCFVGRVEGGYSHAGVARPQITAGSHR